MTRRLYRSGESEYLIDGQICRLRDIHELLMDTGLGAKAYAIIEQGKIGMILSTRPTDRRQLIEEAAGVTKYKARRRSAELKLEAAQQNLTRIDDIVFEVEKQRGTLKRQAAKARRYQKLRDELRRWEKVLFARKYRQLAQTIESVRARLADARERESAAAARLAGVESDLSRVRIELVEAETAATARREAAHACELGINRQQQQIAFDRKQIQTLAARATSVTAEIDTLDARREPVASWQRPAGAPPTRPMPSATERRRRWRSSRTPTSAAHREIEGLEADVEAARSEVFSSINSATALRHSLEHAAVGPRSRRRDAGEARRREPTTCESSPNASPRTRRRPPRAFAARRRPSRRRESRAWRASRSWPARASSTNGGRDRSASREQELAGLEARLKSLEELEAARAEYGDAARTVLAQANGKVGQRGAIADYLEVEAGYERAVEACLGDLLQHVIVEEPEQAAAGFQLVRDQRAGRCGFLIADTRPRDVGRRDSDAGRLRVAFRGSGRAVVGGQGERSVCRRRFARRSARRGLPIHMTSAAEASRSAACADRDEGRRRVPRAASGDRGQP